MAKTWTADELLALARSYQPACVLAAAVDLEVFSVLASRPLTVEQIARRLAADVRGMTVLLDALVALHLLNKRWGRYSVPRNVALLLAGHGAKSVLAMLQHQANCLRRWAQLPEVVQTGRPAHRTPSIRGEEADAAAFIGAMHVINTATAGKVIRAIRPLRFRHLLDVGGASGTWTMAFLRKQAAARATLFDLPHVIPLARKRLRQEGFIRRVKLVAGDFMRDRLPAGADLTWVSAIVHQNSRQQNRQLFAKVWQALVAGGRIAIRDVLMNESRTAPASGALFAINMLVATEAGGTYTFGELREDLESVGFTEVRLIRRDVGMDSVMVAWKHS